ncbi:hypothetical protein KFL_007180060 [Klebsormidium nitens]|uniref:Uncharacterized protein n=1 Tax=Klebsormidium nitens TaxID=105231 RepID=A0A1Y1IJH7_KLENI|nr:hypothetical protein KFL_007180060 [Klebsormidium nitens]|eukprot:GAQ91045.1 hypothetical protein KFL_007180060 [Klebsormidium nitens]
MQALPVGTYKGAMLVVWFKSGVVMAGGPGSPPSAKAAVELPPAIAEPRPPMLSCGGARHSGATPLSDVPREDSINEEPGRSSLVTAAASEAVDADQPSRLDLLRSPTCVPNQPVTSVEQSPVGRDLQMDDAPACTLCRTPASDQRFVADQRPVQSEPRPLESPHAQGHMVVREEEAASPLNVARPALEDMETERTDVQPENGATGGELNDSESELEGEAGTCVFGTLATSRRGTGSGLHQCLTMMDGLGPTSPFNWRTSLTTSARLNLLFRGV